MNKNIALGVGLLMIASPLLALAQTTSTNSSLLATLQALVVQLEQELQQLIASKFSTQSQEPITASASSPQPAASGMTTDVALVCNASASLKRGDTDATTGGQVSRLQAMLGISPTTGYFGAQTAIGYNNICIGGNSQPTSVVGMSEYTDSNFGFSFWYPSSWTVTASNADNTYVNSMYATGATIEKTLTLKDPADPSAGFYINEVNSPNMYIYGDPLNDPSPVSFYEKYYLDASAGQWMVTVNDLPTGKAGGTSPADISNNTMGGLHIFQGYYRFGAMDIVPLSATNFLAIYSNDRSGEVSIQQVLDIGVKTIVATSPVVSIPVSTTQQTADIQAEANAYGVNGSTSQEQTASSLAAEANSVNLYASPVSTNSMTVNFEFLYNAGATQLAFGDGQSVSFSTPGCPPNPDGMVNQSCSYDHTYASPGTYTTQLEDADGNTIGTNVITVPGSSVPYVSVQPTASIDQNSLTSASGEVTITGTVKGLSSVAVDVGVPTNGSGSLAPDWHATVPVQNGAWSFTPSPTNNYFVAGTIPLSPGSYIVGVSYINGIGTQVVLAQGTLTVTSQ